MKQVLAKCLKTYPDESDMQRYCDGKYDHFSIIAQKL